MFRGRRDDYARATHRSIASAAGALALAAFLASGFVEHSPPAVGAGSMISALVLFVVILSLAYWSG